MPRPAEPTGPQSRRILHKRGPNTHAHHAGTCRRVPARQQHGRSAGAPGAAGHPEAQGGEAATCRHGALGQVVMDDELIDRAAAFIAELNAAAEKISHPGGRALLNQLAGT